MPNHSPTVMALPILLIGFLSAADIAQADNVIPPVAATPCQATMTFKPVTIGSKEDIGTVSKIEETVGGLFGGALGGLFGGGIGVGDTDTITDSAGEMEIFDSPIGDLQTFSVPETDISVDVGALIAEDGKLLVSSKINNAPGKGTFHSINLHNMDCQQKAPTRYIPYGLYRDWSLWVQYTHTTEHYTNGKLGNREVKKTDWSKVASGSELLGTGDITVADQGKPIQQSGIWRDFGFDRATVGLNWVGSEFDTTRMDFNRPLGLSITITIPNQDPVQVVPLNLLTCRQGDGSVKLLDVKRKDGVSTLMGVPVSRGAFERWIEAGAREAEARRLEAERVAKAEEFDRNWQTSFVDAVAERWCRAWSKNVGNKASATDKDAGDDFMEAFINAFGGEEVEDPEPVDTIGDWSDFFPEPKRGEPGYVGF